MTENPSDPQVIVIDVTLAQVDHDVPNLWVKIPLVIKDKVEAQINVDVLDVDGHLALGWEVPVVESLSCINSPVLEGRNIHLDLAPSSIHSSQIKFNVLEIQVQIRVFDII